MSRDTCQQSSGSLHVESVGGIDETTVQFSPGITALVGPNATNRTSLLQAIAGAIGSDRITLKGDASAGRTRLVVGEETYTRELERRNGTVELDGDPYLDDSELADLYAVLLEDNEVRRAVRRGDGLRDLIMRPVDTEGIREEVSSLVDERQEIDAELDRLDALGEQLPDLEAERSERQEELETVEADLAEKRSRIEEADDVAGDVDPAEAESALEERLASLQEAREELQEVEQRLSVERRSIESLREEREGVAEQYDAMESADERRLAVVEERIDGLRERKRSLESSINELQRVVRFNREQLDDGDSLLNATDAADGDPTDELLAAETETVCWTCGSEVSRSRIEGTVERLEELRRERIQERNRVRADLEELSEERDELARLRDEREGLAERLEELESDLERRESTVKSLEQRRAELAERVSDLEREVEEHRDAQQEELLSVQKAVSELGFERDQLEERITELDDRIAEIESELERRPALEDRRSNIAEELSDLRTRIDRIEADAVDAFNTHMDAILEALGYHNVERIWIEATERAVTGGRREVTEQSFELHVVRESDDGTAYEDIVEHLSESEREVVGLVVALAGYLVHDVAEEVPFMLLDSLEMIDGQRLVDLVSYLRDHVPYLFVVLLPDHAGAFESADAPPHRRVTDI